MHSNVNKMWLMSAASLATVTSYVNADGDSAQMRNMENRLSALEQKKGAGGVINPSGRPETIDGWDFFITADVLLWQAHEGGLGFAIESKQNNIHTPLDHSHVENVHFDYDWGFRLGAGYNMAHDGWDLYANWTRINMHSHNHEHNEIGENFLWPVWIHPSNELATQTSAEKADAHWRMHLNIIDLELGREFFTSKWLTLRPHVGLRTAWINQHYDVDYEGITQLLTDETEDFLGKADIHMRNKYWGLGPRFGFDTQWGLGSGWSIFGNVAFSLLYGYFNTHFHEKGDNKYAVDPLDASYAHVHNSFRQSTAITDLQLGLRWDHMFSKERYHFGIQAGWEHHMFFSQNQLTRFVAGGGHGNFILNQGDLTTQGWTLSARFGF
ncbi:MAG TPA: Lpg1974 family pore-forming outer membrane protein [Rhabdochlamydiaceae bacterium]|nr:Lpg1974 family pore-forming outer membrane protein [Rhabdochlamydiaceae bacterium]